MIDGNISKIEMGKNFSDYKCVDGNILDIRKLNIFVGSNNSGKSRFIRKILDKSSYGIKYTNDTLDSLYVDFKNYLNDLYKYRLHTTGLIDGERELVKLLNSKNEKLGDFTKGETFKELKLMRNVIEQLCKLNKFKSSAKFTITDIDNKINKIEKIYKDFISETDKRQYVYIPTLRGLRELGYIGSSEERIEKCFTDAKLDRRIEFDKDFYKGRTLKDYWKDPSDYYEAHNYDTNTYSLKTYEKSKNVAILTGLGFFDDITDMLLGTTEQRESIKNWEVFLNKNFFNEKVTITPNREEKTIYIQIGEDENAIHDLGDGLQTILIITFALFKYKNANTVLAIEEPELYLHPGYQRKLIEVMLNDAFNNIQYFVTTHSNHFLDLVIEYPEDIMVYHTKKKDKGFLIEKRSDELTIDLLENLGVRASSLFLSNAIIMVEGISDIIYFRKYLQVYMVQDSVTEYLLDKHYTFIESAGNNIVHWDFLEGMIPTKKIIPNLYIIVDDDNVGDLNCAEEDLTKKQKRIKDLRNMDNCSVLKVRETENLISGKILKETIIKKELYYKVKKGGKPRDIVEDNIPDFNQEDYRDEYLGKYIDEKMKFFKGDNGGVCSKYGNQVEGKGKELKGSGTISDKLGFAKEVVKNIKSFEDLTNDAKELTEKLYKFIEKKNS